MRIHRWLLIMGLMIILAPLAGCGQQSSTGGGTNATPTPTHVPSPAVTNTPLPTAATGPVTLTVGARSYHTTETISVTLSNQSTQAISFPDHLTNCTVIQLQRQVNEHWENVNACLLMTPTRLHQLDAARSLSFPQLLARGLLVSLVLSCAMAHLKPLAGRRRLSTQRDSRSSLEQTACSGRSPVAGSSRLTMQNESGNRPPESLHALPFPPQVATPS